MPVSLHNDHVALEFKTKGGHLDHIRFSDGKHRFSPMHRAPWIDEYHPDYPVILQQLSGDFFCAPFGESDIEPAPPHGWSSNGNWLILDHEENQLVAELDRRIYGAKLTKRVTLQSGSPFIYHLHEFSGGNGAIPISYHAMLRCQSQVQLSFSRKALGYTVNEALEPDPTLGRSLLAYPQQFTDIQSVRLANGHLADLSVYPWNERHEDILHLVSPNEQVWGWTAALCKEEGWVYLAIKPETLLPLTTLWQSHGGRNYPPFNGSHTHVLGLEEGCAYSHLGHKASTSCNPINQQGYPTAIALHPKGKTQVGYAFAVFNALPNWQSIHSVEVRQRNIRVTGNDGTHRDISFAPSLLHFSVSNTE
ncbi:hypothetical protein HC752_02720 [Vibrio sp. S9_S30]|uniref:hypothetical protein n=1 Tax=Vibrio sp. S9_S30 TaxID=2720226 RepID=UPI001680C11E|nr:hypothetical protein [Vibrio sp. S9_S30]MBD1555851.1 hypothetical protein [Vibrio sp. S9_S30]